jgi:hypothetical protein
MNNIYLINNDWEGECYFDDNKIIRKDNTTEIGNYKIEKNKIIIKWEKWDEEIYLCNENLYTYYLKNIYDKNFYNFYLFNKEIIELYVLNKTNNTFFNFDNNKLYGNYKLGDKILELNYVENNYIKNYKKINNNIYYYIEKNDNIINSNIFFELNIVNNLIENNYIFNKLLKKFYDVNNLNNCGNYEMIDNSIYMKWNNGYKKKFFTNKYVSLHNEINEISNNINIIKPTTINIDDRILFSNISLCKNKIILTSIYYKDCPWNLNNIIINVLKNKIINKKVYENDDYESSLTIIIELENIESELYISINYKDYYFNKIYLKQLNIKEHNISAMTLFKDDYFLLKRYLKYYANLGIEVFFIYYNDKIDNTFLNNITKLNDNNYIIYLIEWNYSYMWYYDNNLKHHHHAQTMAINDSFNILKNYGNYTLYNDLDEYFILNNYKNFNELINDIDNVNIDIFVFKNRFCKIGNDPIKYKDFDRVFNLDNIIEGNYWNEQREKNLVKLKNINVLGVHGFFTKFNDDYIGYKIISQFYHIVNFEEKNRENLMTEYIT